MTHTIYAKHLPYEDGHLGKVTEDMRLAGPPTIRVMKHGDAYYALEGSHRLAAAHALGLEPKLVVEIPEAGEGLTEFWTRVAPTLPPYDFDHVHELDLAKFEFGHGMTEIRYKLPGADRTGRFDKYLAASMREVR